MAFTVDKVTDALVRKGSGPIPTATSLAVTRRLDRIGKVDAEMPATDERAAFDLDTLEYIRTRIDGTPTDVGIIKERTTGSTSQQQAVSGPTLAGELEHGHVGRLFVHGATETDPMPAVDVLSAILDGSGWTHVGVPSRDFGPYQFGDEKWFAALTKVAEILGDHFRESETVPRQLEWLSATPTGFIPVSSGLRTTDVGDPHDLENNDNVVIIDGGLTEIVDAYSRITRIYPRGAGNGSATLYINAATVPLPAGYTMVVNALRPDLSYIKHDASDAAGSIGAPETFRDIAPIGTSPADEIAAANLLVEASIVALRKRLRAQRSYRFRITKLRKPLRIGESLHLICKHFSGTYGWMNINEHVLVLETKPSWTRDGRAAMDLQVTQVEVDRWPVTEGQMLMQVRRDVKTAVSHVQPAQRALSATTTSDPDLMRLSGAQDVTGIKTFTTSVHLSNAVGVIRGARTDNVIATMLRLSNTDYTQLFAPSAATGIQFLSTAGAVLAEIAANGQLRVNGAISAPVAAKTAAYTLTPTDSTIRADASSGAFSVMLPTAVGISGRVYTIKRINSGANAVTVATTSAQTIDGAATQTLSTQYAAIMVQSNGANWDIIGKV